MAAVADRRILQEYHRMKSSYMRNMRIWLNIFMIRGIRFLRRWIEMREVERRRFTIKNRRIRIWKTLNRLTWRRIGRGRLCIIFSSSSSIHSTTLAFLFYLVTVWWFWWWRNFKTIFYYAIFYLFYAVFNFAGVLFTFPCFYVWIS